MRYYIFIFFIVLILLVIYKNTIQNFETYEIPKIIWSYWDSTDTIPEAVSKIVKDRNKVLYDWEPRLLTNETIGDYINKDEYPDNYNGLAHCHKADWIRLYLLKKYGGVWLDASIIINSNKKFNDIYTTSIEKKSQITVYYLGDVPLEFVENWYIMAPKNSYIINKWYNEFTRAIQIGFANYKTELIQNGIKVSQIYLYGPDDTYLTMHAAMQKLIQSKDINIDDVLLYNSCESMYKLHCDCQWQKECMINKLKDKQYLSSLDFIKLRSSERELLQTK
jgi:hypothetical protein